MKDENGNRRAIEEKVVVYWSKKFQLRAERENKKFLDFLKKLQEHPENFRITAYRFMDVDDPNPKRILDSFGIGIPAKLYRRAGLKSIKNSRNKNFHVGYKCRYIFSKSHKPHKHWKICIVTVKMEPLRLHFGSYKWQTQGLP